jgi:RNA polymerase sigma-70 factor, ECF subfamily
MDRAADITRMLNLAAEGDQAAAERVYEAVYDDLKALAAGIASGERAPGTMHATALVNEAYLRLCGQGHQHWENRRHFFGAAARAMQRVLAERGRRRGPAALTLGDAGAPVSEDRVDWEAFGAALESLRQRDARSHEIVMLRFFSGLGVELTGELMGVSPRLVKREWRFARAWLYRQLINGV